MGNVDAFLRSLLRFDKDNVPLANVERVERDFTKQPGFTPEAVRAKSAAAAGLCAWVINICKYYRIYQVLLLITVVGDGSPMPPCVSDMQVVAPKRAALAEASKRLDASNRKLQGIRAKVKDLSDRVAALELDLMKVVQRLCIGFYLSTNTQTQATEEKNARVMAAERTANKMALANRLINGLAGENKRWSEIIVHYTQSYGEQGANVSFPVLLFVFFPTSFFPLCSFPPPFSSCPSQPDNTLPVCQATCLVTCSWRSSLCATLGPSLPTFVLSCCVSAGSLTCRRAAFHAPKALSRWTC